MTNKQTVDHLLDLKKLINEATGGLLTDAEELQIAASIQRNMILARMINKENKKQPIKK